MSDPHDQSSEPSDGSQPLKSEVTIGRSYTGNQPYWRVKVCAGEEHLIDALTASALKAFRGLTAELEEPESDG